MTALRTLFSAALLTVVVCACARDTQRASDAASPPGAEPTAAVNYAAPNLPPEVLTAVKAAVPDMTIREAERKERDGRVYYDVEGVKADGSEIELDLLGENGAFKVVEIQRDIAWADAPEVARTAAGASSKPFEPARVIESRQTDGSVIYELFTQGAPAKPALEVRVMDGKAEVLKDEWPH
jgi:hypothetical protein